MLALVGLFACASAVSRPQGSAIAKHTVLKRQEQQHAPARQQAASVRGGAVFGGRVMDLKTSLKYKAGLAAETGLLLAVLQGAKVLHDKFSVPIVHSNPKIDARIIDFGVWALVVFGSDGIIGLIRKLQVKLGWSQPRITLAQAQASWYNHLAKPDWTPPEWVFPAVWIPLKLLQVFAARIIWVKTGRNPLSTPVVLFALHQALGDLWNTAFFRERYIAGGLSIIYQFAAALVAATYTFYQTDNLAGALLVPTCVWVVVATSLNQSIYNKNKPIV